MHHTLWTCHKSQGCDIEVKLTTVTDFACVALRARVLLAAALVAVALT